MWSVVNYEVEDLVEKNSYYLIYIMGIDYEVYCL